MALAPVSHLYHGRYHLYHGRYHLRHGTIPRRPAVPQGCWKAAGDPNAPEDREDGVVSVHPVHSVVSVPPETPPYPLH